MVDDVKLTPKQRAFADFYIKTGNAAEAARKAGYSQKTADSIGRENLRKPTISAYISERMSELEKNRIASADEVVVFFSDVMRGKIKDQFGIDASVADRLKAGDSLMKRHSAAENAKRNLTREEKDFRIPGVLLSKEFVDLNRDISDRRHTEYVLKGGRGSTKSSFISLKIIELIKNNQQMHALCCRKVGNTLRDSVYAQIQWAITALGLDDEFDGTKSPLEITYTPTGQKIFFRGTDEPKKLKSVKAPFGYIGILWFEELDQFSGDAECRNVQQSVIRGGDDAYIFKSFNPPKAKNNWANLSFEAQKETRLVHSSDYRSVPPEWLGKTFLDEAEYQKEINPAAYEHEYLGVPNGNGGMVFENVVSEAITDQQIETFDRVLNGVDWGYYPDPWAFNRMQYDAARRTLYIFDELTAYKKGNRETADMLLKDIGLKREDRITADSAEPKSVADYLKFGLKCFNAKKGPGSVDYSMKWLQSLVKIVIDPVRCPDTYKEFTEYEYERTKDGEIISGYPDMNNHHIDAVRYATEIIWKVRGQ